ncbi:hypothetical protein LCGC14_1175690 [marine sediment metagenome]|uniref:Uncharacterized protein n=1 Tax=marine sediment metagenome TaxID=412755 RepID=A0A0F9P6M2_9ZZZZ
MKSTFQSKTVWLGLATLALSILAFFQGEEWVKEYPKVVAGIGSAIGFITIVLRFFTSKTMALSDSIKHKLR